MSTVFVSVLRTACLVSIMMLASFVVFAYDNGQYYIIHARIEMKNGSVKTGYFNVLVDGSLIQYDESGGFYFYHAMNYRKQMRLHAIDSTSDGVRPAESDYHFSHDLLSRMGDTLQFYVNARVIDVGASQYSDRDFIAAMVGPAENVAAKDIEYISIESIRGITAANEGRLSVEDLSWIGSNAVFRGDAGGTELCASEAVSFKTPDEAVLVLLKELQKLADDVFRLPNPEGYEKMLRKRSEIIESLRRERVVVFSVCSC